MSDIGNGEGSQGPNNSCHPLHEVSSIAIRQVASDDLRQDIAPVEGGENNSLGGGRGEGYSKRLGVRGIGV